MANLVDCLDCGQPISQSASVCPKCHTDCPRGVKCSACGKGTIPKKKALYSIEHCSYYHPECVKRILSIPDTFLCPDCNIRVNQNYDWQKLFHVSNVYGLSCPNCGLPSFLDSKSIHVALGCGICNLPLLGFHEIVVAYDESSHNLESYHDLCAPECIKEKDVTKHKLQRETNLKKSSTGCTALMLVILLAILLLTFKIV